VELIDEDIEQTAESFMLCLIKLDESSRVKNSVQELPTILG